MKRGNSGVSVAQKCWLLKPGEIVHGKQRWAKFRADSKTRFLHRIR